MLAHLCSLHLTKKKNKDEQGQILTNLIKSSNPQIQGTAVLTMTSLRFSPSKVALRIRWVPSSAQYIRPPLRSNAIPRGIFKSTRRFTTPSLGITSTSRKCRNCHMTKINGTIRKHQPFRQPFGKTQKLTYHGTLGISPNGNP